MSFLDKLLGAALLIISALGVVFAYGQSKKSEGKKEEKAEQNKEALKAVERAKENDHIVKTATRDELIALNERDGWVRDD